jgi:hypothetical protein
MKNALINITSRRQTNQTNLISSLFFIYCKFDKEKIKIETKLNEKFKESRETVKYLFLSNFVPKNGLKISRTFY